jgi:predicted neuraminidase
LPLIVFAAALAWCWPRLQALPQPAFSILPAVKPSTAGANNEHHADMLPRVGASAHSVTLARRADGKLLAAWFAGSREGASDVAIFSSVFDGGAWSAPVVIVDRQRVERDTGRLIRKLGNPLLWRDAQNVLHLWFVSVSYGGWAGSAINHLQSGDGGQHWTNVTRVVTSPFWNLSTLVRNPPLALADGGIAVPAYHEFLTKRPEWLRFDSQMQLVDKVRIPNSARTLQPAVVALDQHRALALMRDSGPLHRIHAARTDDAGSDWQPATATVIPNPDAAVTLLRLADGSLLMACNPLESNRNQLALLRSRDEGGSWSAPMVVEQGASDDEFSYPALLQDDAGAVHLAYTWKRQTIKHETLQPAQIEGMK